MSASNLTVSGYVVSIPQDGRKCRIALQHEDNEYHVLPKGAGVDLADEVNGLVQVTGTVEVVDEISYLTVRGFKILEENAWDEDA